eukprot:scaffold11371_cov112-Isochrysis_galbana.AAC.4
MTCQRRAKIINSGEQQQQQKLGRHLARPLGLPVPPAIPACHAVCPGAPFLALGQCRCIPSTLHKSGSGCLFNRSNPLALLLLAHTLRRRAVVPAALLPDHLRRRCFPRRLPSRDATSPAAVAATAAVAALSPVAIARGAPGGQSSLLGPARSASARVAPLAAPLPQLVSPAAPPPRVARAAAGEGAAGPPRARRPATPVDVVGRCGGHVVVDDQIDGGNVQAACSHISRDEQRQRALLQLGDGSGAAALGLLRVEWRARQVEPEQHARQQLARLARGGEDDDCALLVERLPQ